MSEIRITCINKDNGDHYDPHECITHFGWVNEANGSIGKVSKLGMIEYIQDGHRAFVKTYGSKVYLVIRKSRYNNLYLKTESDDREANNLLSLPECTG